MTELTTDAAANARDANDFRPSGHPVRRAVLALLVLVVTIALLWWSGLAAPRVAFTGGSSSYDEITQQGSATVSLKNDGLFPITIVDADPVDNDQDFRLLDRVEIGGGEQADVIVLATIDCSEPITDGSVSYELVVETAVGLERRVSDGFIASVIVANCPAPA